MKTKLLYLSSAIAMALVSHHGYANCILDKANIDWTSDITFHCDQATNLTKNPIIFDVTNGVTVHHAWGLSAPTAASTTNNQVTVTTGQQWWPKQDLILPANQSVTLSFTPSENHFSISNFHVGSVHPTDKGTISFSLDSQSAAIPDQAEITLTPTGETQGAGYHFTWQEVKSGAAHTVNTGSYAVSVVYQNDHITAIPSEVVIAANHATSVKLDYQQYQGELRFSIDHTKPNNASNIKVHITDTTTHASSSISLPWDNQTVTFKNLSLHDTYRFSADQVIANNQRYDFTFSPEEVSPSKTKSVYQITVTAHGHVIPTYPVQFMVSGLPNETLASDITLKNASGEIVEHAAHHNGSFRYDLPAGTYKLSAQTINFQGYNYIFNQGASETITVSKNTSNAYTIAFTKTQAGSAVAGWPSYIAMGAVTDATTTNPGQLEGRDVDAIFKYAGDGGNGDPGKIVFPIYTYNTMTLAETLSQKNNHAVKPVMVVYTGEMSGGVNFKDFTSTNLVMHFVNLMLVAQTLQNGKNLNGDVGSIVLNPDLLGAIQQTLTLEENDKNDKKNNKMEKFINEADIRVNETLKKAYWFITTPHDWSLKLTNGKTVIIKNTTPEGVIQQAVNGDLKPQGVYSAWDIKTAWEEAAIAILEQAPSHLDENIPTFTNNFTGWIQATNWAIKTTGPDVTFGWQENVWNVVSANWVHHNWPYVSYKSDGENNPPKVDIIHDFKVDIMAPTVELLTKLHVYNGAYKPNFLVFDKYEMDPIPAAAGVGYVWNARDWDNYLNYVKQLSTDLGNVPVMLWQIPGEHLQLTNGIDTRNNHAATAPDYFFGDTNLSSGLTNLKAYIYSYSLPYNPNANYPIEPHSVYQCVTADDCQLRNYLTMNGYTWHHSNMQKAKDSHVFAILWGGGSTTSVGTFPLDDGGWLKDKVNAYEQHPTEL